MRQNIRPDVKRLFDLQEFLHSFHFIERVVRIPGKKGRNETDTEHTFTLAMTAWFLAQYFPELDTNLCIRYALVHDLVEIHAGDTFAYATEEVLASKLAREKAALDKIKITWKDFPEMIDAIENYEKHSNMESCFIYALDKLMPPLIIYMDKGHTWRENKITFQMHHDKKNSQITKSPQVMKYYEQLVKLMREDLLYFYQKD